MITILAYPPSISATVGNIITSVRSLSCTNEKQLSYGFKTMAEPTTAGTWMKTGWRPSSVIWHLTVVCTSDLIQISLCYSWRTFSKIDIKQMESLKKTKILIRCVYFDFFYLLDKICLCWEACCLFKQNTILCWCTMDGENKVLSAQLRTQD